MDWVQFIALLIIIYLLMGMKADLAQIRRDTKLASAILFSRGKR